MVLLRNALNEDMGIDPVGGVFTIKGAGDEATTIVNNDSRFWKYGVWDFGTGADNFFIEDKGAVGASSDVRFVINTSGNVGIGTTTPATKLEVNGFTKLGSDAPKIKVKKITGTTGAVGAIVSVNHGLNIDKIVSATCQVKSDNGLWMYPEWEDATYNFNFYIKSTQVDVKVASGGTSVDARPMVIYITYEE